MSNCQPIANELGMRGGDNGMLEFTGMKFTKDQ